MRKTTLLKSMLLLCALIVGSTSVWGDEITYTFTSKAWAATAGGNAANWTSGKDGTALTSERGVKVQADASGANATSPTSLQNISQIVVTYSTNASAGDGSIAFKVGTGTAKSQEVTKTGGTTDRTLTYNFSPAETGNVQITVTCTTNSIYVKSVQITYSASGKSPAGLSYATSKYATTFGASFDMPTLTNPNSLAVTYSTSDATIADVNLSTGAVTIKSKAGNATITASTEGDETHDAGNASYKIYVYEHSGTSSASAFTVAEANDFITNTLYGAGNYYVAGIVSQTSSTISSGKNTYYISDDGSGTNQLQVYLGKDLENANFTSSTLVKLGEEVVVYGPLTLYNTKPEINTGNYLYSITRKTDANLSVHSDASIEVTEEISDVYTTDSDGDVTITSSNPEIAAMEGNKLVAYKAGTTNITVNVASNATYAGAVNSFDVTVTVKDPVAPAGIGDVPGYYLVKNIANLANNDEVLIVGVNNANNYAMAAQNENIRNGVAVSAGFDFIGSKPVTAQAVTLEKDGDYWYFKVGDDAYLYASGGTTNNYVATGTKTVASTDDKGKAAVTIDGETGAATVTFRLTESGAKNLFRFNYNSGNPRFTCYGSGQAPVYFYKKKEGTSYNISVGAAGWRTIVPAASASLPDGLKAYIVTGDVDDGKATLTKVASIKAGEAYVLNGDEGNYTLTVIDSPAEPTGNKLRVSTELDGNGAYVLANKLSHGVGFYLWNGGSLGAGRVILPADAVTSAREFIAFDNETTGIKNLTPALSQGEGAWYDLQGRRVAQPTKGLYIVNGKKVFVP